MHIDWRTIFKVLTGIVVVPVAIAANKLWPWWEKASLPMKILTAPVVLPLAGFAYATSFWWDGFH